MQFEFQFEFDFQLGLRFQFEFGFEFEVEFELDFELDLQLQSESTRLLDVGGYPRLLSEKISFGFRRRRLGTLQGPGKGTPARIWPP